MDLLSRERKRHRRCADVFGSHGNAMVPGSSRTQGEANERDTGPDLYALRSHAAQLQRSVRHDKPGDTYWPALDGSLAVRRKGSRTRVGNAGRRNDGDVCGHAVGTPSYLWFAVGWKRIPLGRSRRLDDVLRPLLMPRDENMMPIHDKLIVSILRYCEIAGVMHLSISTVVDAMRRATVKLAREFDTKVSL